MVATRAWSGTTVQRVSDKLLLVTSSSETKVLPWESFIKGEGADSLLQAAVELRGYYIEPTEILVGQ